MSLGPNRVVAPFGLAKTLWVEGQARDSQVHLLGGSF